MIVDGDKRIMTADELETFIYQAKLQERWECAKIVEQCGGALALEVDGVQLYFGNTHLPKEAAATIARAIRNRK